MLRAEWAPYNLRFRVPAITSRERMLEKSTYFIRIFDPADSSRFAIGECALFKGLSAEDTPIYEQSLAQYCKDFSRDNAIAPSPLSSVRFGFETALADWKNGALHTPFPSQWTRGWFGIRINGLVWMGTVDEMYSRAVQKIKEGFNCIKFKIGGCDFESEIKLLEKIRKFNPVDRLEIRLDANGAFSPDEALRKLERLAIYGIHSIEQPIRPRQWKDLARICNLSPIPVALDEELIGLDDMDEKDEMLGMVSPSFLVLKPSLCGGFQGASEWIDLARKRKIGWWITSALESAVGLNAIASWVAGLSSSLPQGLGTGQLYLNDIVSPVYREGQNIFFNPSGSWDFPEFDWRDEERIR